MGGATLTPDLGKQAILQLTNKHVVRLEVLFCVWQFRLNVDRDWMEVVLEHSSTGLIILEHSNPALIRQQTVYEKSVQ